MKVKKELLIEIPHGRFADDSAAKARRELLRQKLLTGARVPLGNSGNAMNPGDDTRINIPAGKLAGFPVPDDSAARARRVALREKLLNGGRVVLRQDGNAMGENGTESSISIPGGKLAATQWYEQNPGLLEAEKMVMHRAFPNFQLGKLDDGRLYWVGTLNVGIYESKYGTRMEYHVMALYQNNHPHQQMGSSVRVYPVLPDVQELIDKCGFRPYHLLRDSDDQLYLCTNEAEDMKTGNDITTAASVLGWACKWFAAYELVMTGDMKKEDFMTAGRI